MKYDRPRSSESCTLMLVWRSHSGRDICRAQTQPPAWASTMLRPIERSSVLFPDMFDPVMRRTVPAGPTVTSLATRRSSGMSGWPMPAAVTSPNRPDRWDGPLGIVATRSAELPERIELAQGVEPDSDPASARPPPPLEREQHVEIPQSQRLHGKVQDRALPQLAEPEDPIQPTHACRRWLSLCRQPVEEGLAGATKQPER